ncbi:MAG: hypothetical protein IPM51_11925 [Sphingobacteriaceae bacterium]|nr:hypothetical protein [Sphingobacteriaceae bacterium]
MAFVNLVNTEVEVGGYTFSPLTLNDLGSFVLYFQYYKVFEAETVTKNFPPELRAKLLETAYNECYNMRLPVYEVNKKTGEKKLVDSIRPVFEHPEVQAFSATMHGMNYEMFLSLRHKHPNITLEEVNSLMTPYMLKEVQDKLMCYMDEIQEQLKKAEETLPGESFPSLTLPR